MAKAGVYQTKKKDGSVYYRVSITYRSKHISLGSFSDEQIAHQAYEEAQTILREGKWSIADFDKSRTLSLEKFVILMNYRDNGIYFKTPMYLYPRHFEYYLSPTQVLKFDRDDLFFYASHKIMVRQGRLFYCDYGNQYGILTRYGMKSYSVPGRDFHFVNGDNNDYRYSNILVINQYMGVLQNEKDGKTVYDVYIHVRGNYKVGTYDNEETAAIAYNKAANLLKERGSPKSYIKNYITGLSKVDYQKQYDEVRISPALYELKFPMQNQGTV